MFHNPTYDQTAPPPSHLTQYSSQGPGDTPTDHTLQPFSEHACHPEGEEREGEAVYEVLKDTQGEVVYRVLENTGGRGGERDGGGNKVPIHCSSGKKGESLTMPPHTQGKAEMGYSMLQHQ